MFYTRRTCACARSILFPFYICMRVCKLSLSMCAGGLPSAATRVLFLAQNADVCMQISLPVICSPYFVYEFAQ